MSRSHPKLDPALRSQIDGIVARYAQSRRTSTEEEAFGPIREGGYDAGLLDRS